jgi:hypothetical protein
MVSFFFQLVSSRTRWVLVPVLLLACGRLVANDAQTAAAQPSHAERMVAQGWIRYRGAWRTAQEIELIERKEAATIAEKQWTMKLGRLRKQLDSPATADRAAEELREISDPLAVPAITSALSVEPVLLVRAWYVESLARIRSPAAFQTIVAVALDHPDPETRINAAERLVAIGPEPAVPRLVAALASADNAQVNRAAEALGRLGVASAILPLIAALETRHVSVITGPPAGSTSATFSPTGGGGLAMGGGPKQQVVVARNERVLAALVALTGANFEWDSVAWRAWFASERSLPADFDPRRG